MRNKGLDRLTTYKISKSDGTYLTRKPLTDKLIEAINQNAKGRVLDIGCGNKPYLELFDGLISEYIGCDIVQSSENKVDILCEANSIPVDSSSFDTVFSTQTIEHVFDHHGLVREAYRALKPGGTFIVSGPMYWPHHEEPYDFYRFTRYGFKTLLENAGFIEVKTLENGGKWALFGQVMLHTFPNFLTGTKIYRYFHNSFFEKMDKVFFDSISTTNFVVTAKKSS